MLIAFISDIHGNLPALEAAVADAEARGANRIICAGGMTGYGPFPDAVCRFLEERRIPAIIGNYDQKVIELAKRGSSGPAGMKAKKRKILVWTVKHVTDQTRRSLADLPENFALRLPGGYKLLVVHGSPISMDDPIYPSLTDRGLGAKFRDKRPDILVCEHTHIPFVKRVGGILVVNCSSTGHPVDGDARPAYALVHAGRAAALRGRTVRFEYDRDRAIAALDKTSLPKGLRKDFAEGSKMRFLP